MWKINPINRVKRRLRHRYPGVRIPASSTILRLVKKVRSTGSFLDTKYTRQNAVLTEEMLDEIGARLEHSPCKSLAWLSQQAWVLKTKGWRATKNLHLRPYKITQVQVIEECYYGREEHIFVTGFCRQYMTVFLTQNLHFSLMKLGSIWVGISVLKTIGIGAVLIRDKTFEVPLHYQKIGVWCAITASWIVGPIFFENTINSEWYVSDILWPFFGNIMEEEKTWLFYAR
jgi:hypothetical protein